MFDFNVANELTILKVDLVKFTSYLFSLGEEHKSSSPYQTEKQDVLEITIISLNYKHVLGQKKKNGTETGITPLTQ